jgi:2-haloalkanoic acid dehalogenase type II
VRKTCLEAFAEIESAVQAQKPNRLYPEALRLAHQLFAKRFALKSTPELDKRFGDFVPFWPAFSDSADMLRRLKANFRLVILSNVDKTSFASSNKRLGVEFDAVFTAEDIGSYKPNPQNFAYMIGSLDCKKTEILHVAQSLFHDIKPAKNAGLDTVWIDRQGLADGGSWGATAKIDKPPTANIRFSSLQEFTEFVCKAK